MSHYPQTGPMQYPQTVPMDVSLMQEVRQTSAFGDMVHALKGKPFPNLVRIKIADDNDIKAARCALATCADFFDNLEELSKLRGKTPFECMQTL